MKKYINDLLSLRENSDFKKIKPTIRPTSSIYSKGDTLFIGDPLPAMLQSNIILL